MKPSLVTSSLWLLFANILWAVNYPLLKMLLPRYISPLALTTMAVIVAAILAQIVDMPIARRERVNRGDIPMIICAGMVMSALRKLFLMEGLVYTSVINGSILSTMGPLLVLIIALFLGRERVNSRKIAGMIIGLSGAVLLIIFSSSSADSSGSSIRGDLFIIAGTLCSSLYITFFQPLIVKYRPITLLRWMYGTSALIMMVVGGWELCWVDYSNFTPVLLLAMIYAAVVPALFPNLILSFSLRFLRPTSVTVFGYAQPIVVMVIAVASGSAKFSVLELLAMFAIAIGVLLVERVRASV